MPYLSLAGSLTPTDTPGRRLRLFLGGLLIYPAIGAVFWTLLGLGSEQLRSTRILFPTAATLRQWGLGILALSALPLFLQAVNQLWLRLRGATTWASAREALVRAFNKGIRFAVLAASFGGISRIYQLFGRGDSEVALRFVGAALCMYCYLTMSWLSSSVGDGGGRGELLGNWSKALFAVVYAGASFIAFVFPQTPWSFGGGLPVCAELRSADGETVAKGWIAERAGQSFLLIEGEPHHLRVVEYSKVDVVRYCSDPFPRSQEPSLSRKK